MHVWRTKTARWWLLAFSCAWVAGFLAFPSNAQAQTRRKHHGLVVALQPFELAHSAVRAVAEPVEREVSKAIAVAVPVHRVEIAERSEPIHVAYVVPRAQAILAPRAELAETESENEPETRDAQPEFSSGDRPMVPGSLAVLRNGIAYAPAHAPQSVKNAIWAVNTLRHKPYTWGGGHGSFYDSGYDCSGTISFAMHYAGALASPISSSEFTRFGERGSGRWITIYARRGHTFANVAGLRLDTTDFRNGGDEGPRWHTDMRDLRGFEARHPAGM